MALSKNVTTRSRIRWSADNIALYFDDRGLKVENFINFVTELLDTAEKMMSEHLLFQMNGMIPEFDLSRVHDPNKHTAGHYFTHDRPNVWMHARIQMSKRLQASNRWHETVELSGDSLKFQKNNYISRKRSALEIYDPHCKRHDGGSHITRWEVDLSKRG